MGAGHVAAEPVQGFLRKALSRSRRHLPRMPHSVAANAEQNVLHGRDPLDGAAQALLSGAGGRGHGIARGRRQRRERCSPSRTGSRRVAGASSIRFAGSATSSPRSRPAVHRLSRTPLVPSVRLRTWRHCHQHRASRPRRRRSQPNPRRRSPIFVRRIWPAPAHPAVDAGRDAIGGIDTQAAPQVLQR